MIDVTICKINQLGESTTETAALSPFFTVNGAALHIQITTEGEQMTLKFPPTGVAALLMACNRYKIAHAETSADELNNPTALPGRSL